MTTSSSPPDAPAPGRWQETYQARPLPAPVMSLTWGVFRRADLPSDLVTAVSLSFPVALCFDEALARQLTWLLNYALVTPGPPADER